MIEFLYDPVIMALWAGLATGALISEIVTVVFKRRALKFAGLNKEEIKKVMDD